MSRPEYQQRVIDEEIELTKKIQALSNFCDGPRWALLSAEEQERMLRQCSHMIAYQNVLAEQIRAF